MKRLFFSLCIILPLSLQAQYLELGAMLGASNYLGDLSNNSSTVYFSQTRPAAGVFARFNMREWFTLKTAFNFAMIAGSDANSDNESIRRRNLNFRTNIYEFGLTGEFNIPGYQPYALRRPFSPYLFGGIALTGFNPKGKYQDKWYNLQPLGTEGQGMPSFESPYSKVAVAIPFGIGFKYALNDIWNLGLEFGVRKTFSDYLDDVGGNYVEYNQLLAGNGQLAATFGNRTGEYLNSEPVLVPTGTPRGDAADSDWYFIAGVSLSVNFIDNGLVGTRKRSRRGGRGCPTN